MKQIIAFIRPAVIERVTEALRGIDGLTGMSVMEIQGFGRGKGAYRKSDDGEISYFSRNVRIELMVMDSIVSEIVDTIRNQAWAGEHGEGKIYILAVEEAVRISSNERGDTAV